MEVLKESPFSERQKDSLVLGLDLINRLPQDIETRINNGTHGEDQERAWHDSWSNLFSAIAMPIQMAMMAKEGSGEDKNFLNSEIEALMEDIRKDDKTNRERSEEAYKVKIETIKNKIEEILAR